MSKTLYFIIAVLIVILLVVFIGSSTKRQKSQPQVTPTPVVLEQETIPTTATSTPTTVESQNVVVYTSAGYSPSTIKIKKSEMVTFKNQSSQSMWTASAIHPNHSVYPGGGIEKCRTGEQFKIFDACGGYENGQSWSFIFTEKGTWRYHNHLSPKDTGTVIVE